MATIMTISGKAIIIEPDWERIKEAKMKLGALKKRRIMIASIHCLNDKFLKIKELTERLNYLKIFHDGRQEGKSRMAKNYSIKVVSQVVFAAPLIFLK